MAVSALEGKTRRLVQLVEHWIVVFAVHDDHLRLNWQTRIRYVTGGVTRNRIAQTQHHWVGWIDNGILATKVDTRLAAKRQGITVF